MPKIIGSEIAPLPRATNITGGEFDWLNQINKVVGNIQSLLTQIQSIQTKTQQATPKPSYNTPQSTTPVQNKVMDNKLKLFIVMFLTSLQQDGKGNVPIGEVISHLPTTVDQVLEYARKL